MGDTVTKNCTITRPNNTTAYAGGDVLDDGTNHNTVDTGLTAGSTVLLTQVNMRVHTNAVPSGMSSFRVHFYDQTPALTAHDNAAYDFVAGDRGHYLGFITLAAPTVRGASTLFSQNEGINKYLGLATESSDLFWVVETVGGFTPGEVSTVYGFDFTFMAV